MPKGIQCSVQRVYIFFQHSDDTGQTQPVRMDIDTGDCPPMVQKPYTLSLKYTQGVKDQHIGLSPDAQKKSAFLTPMGTYVFKKVPFGLSQALAHLQ